ncbi:UPF0739 protein C1orf74 homolog [Mercenaria mercenaria]|uniref:UPF0739 protein C1orf74 homolog n=1 Tax=Mercenaria mercenaria TaxID=6596 RepID=UPI00234F63CD|nr:UPF0739 protein C1orf74 homolog [Mercenaria mercenaria]
MEMEIWRTSITKHLGRKVVRHTESLMVDITAVDIGIKPGYLYDIGQPNGEKIKELLQDLKQQHLIKNNLNVLEIGMDCLIVNVEELRKSAYFSDCNETLIDVSGSKNKPCIRSDKSTASGIKEELDKIIDVLDCNKVKLLPHCYPSCNVSSLFGMVLNYPVVYWYDNLDGKGDNCLSMEKLTSVKVDCLQKNGPKPKSVTKIDRHCLYSFSYPSCLNSVCRPFVDQWFAQLKDRVQHQMVFTDVEITFEEIVLEAVCL